MVAAIGTITTLVKVLIQEVVIVGAVPEVDSPVTEVVIIKVGYPQTTMANLLILNLF